MVEAARSAVRFDPHWQRVYERLKSRRGSNIAAVAVARKLLVAIWHLLHDRARYYYLRPQSFVRKLQDWAWLIGRDHLPADTSADFVRRCLKTIDLPDLAVTLTTNRKGKLIIREPETGSSSGIVQQFSVLLYWLVAYANQTQFPLGKRALFIKPTALICLEEEIALLVTKNPETIQKRAEVAFTVA